MSELSNTPLSVYQEFIAHFKILKLTSERMDINGHRVKAGIEKLIPFEQRDGYLWTLTQHSSNAAAAIKELLLNPNNNSDLLINEIKNECCSISEWLDKLIEENISLKKARGLNDEEITLYYNTLNKDEREQIDLYNTLAIPFYDFYSSFTNLVSPRETEKLNTIPRKSTDYTHRVCHLAHEFKVTAGIEKQLTSNELKKIAAKRYQNSLTLEKTNKNYKAPTKEELERVITLLSDFPAAKKIAEDYFNTHFSK